MASVGLLDRLKNGGDVLVAEGYLFEIERRGYARIGDYTPEVVLKRPEMVKMLHEEFAHAGSDVCLAYTYLGSRHKMKTIGLEGELETLNRKALKIARQVADDTGSLMAGDLAHTWLYESGEENKEVKEMFKEQVEWAVDEKADFIVGETFQDLGEAMLALDAIKEYGNGVPAVITLAAYYPDETLDGVPTPEACKRLEDAGAAVVGLNCGRGPKTMLPLIKEIRKVCKGPIAALPVPCKCDEKHKTWMMLRDPITGDDVFPVDIATAVHGRKELRNFAEQFKAAGVQYFGLCCGNAPSYMREVAEGYGRKTPASAYLPDLSKTRSRSTDPKYAKIQKFMFGNE